MTWRAILLHGGREKNEPAGFKGRKGCQTDFDLTLDLNITALYPYRAQVAREGQSNDRLCWPRRAESHEWGFFIRRSV